MGDIVVAFVLVEGVECGGGKPAVLCFQVKEMFYEYLFLDSIGFVENFESLNEEVEDHDVSGFHAHEFLALHLEGFEVVEFGFGEGPVGFDDDRG